MTHEFRLPDLGEGLTEADIIEWFVEIGDNVEVDQAIVEIETAKTAVEITATHAGTVLHLGGSPGDTVAVGDVLFVIGGSSRQQEEGRQPTADSPQQEEGQQPTADSRQQEEGQQPTADSPQQEEEGQQPTADSQQQEEGQQQVTANSQQQEEEGRQVTADSQQQEEEGRQQEEGRQPTADSPQQEEEVPRRVRAMPIVRKLARERGIDLSSVAGTGHSGAITKADLDAAAGGGHRPELVPMSRRRRAIAHHMSESWATIPHVTVHADIRAEQILRTRGRGRPDPVPIEAIVANAVVPLLSRYQEFNAVVREDSVEYRGGYHIGIAVDTADGLMVVVIRDADTLSLEELAEEIQRLADSAKNGTLKPGEAIGQTFTISNIGALGGGHGTPIIPVGTSAILSIGRAHRTAVVENDAVEIGMVAPLDLSYDHRLIDGSLGQRFLSDLVNRLESADRPTDEGTR